MDIFLRMIQAPLMLAQAHVHMVTHFKTTLWDVSESWYQNVGSLVSGVAHSAL